MAKRVSVVQSCRVFDNSEITDDRKRVKYVAPKLKASVGSKKAYLNTQSVLV